MTPPRIDADHVRALIDASGLSIREWARTVAGRDHRTVLRWLAGEPIPSQAQDWLARIHDVSTTAHRVTVTVMR